MIILLEPDIRALVIVIPQNSSSPTITHHFLGPWKHFILNLSIIPTYQAWPAV